MTEIYESARFKLSDSLVNGKALAVSAKGIGNVAAGGTANGRSKQCYAEKEDTP